LLGFSGKTIQTAVRYAVHSRKLEQSGYQKVVQVIQEFEFSRNGLKI